MKAFLQNVLVVVMATLISIGIIELGCWGWMTFVRGDYLARWEFRATQPAPYQEAEYFNRTFLEESETFVNGRLTSVAELNDYSGQYFNIKDGFRVTTDIPKLAERRVLLFGGSTLFGQEVPDHHTIASYLQRMLNESGQPLEVRNFGLPGMNAEQQVEILRRVGVREGDIVLFYHGVNDIFYVVFGGAEQGWRKGVPVFRPVQKLSPVAQWMAAWHKKLKNYSYTADLALDIFDRSTPSTISDDEELQRGVRIAARRFKGAIVSAEELVRQSGAEFKHYLQPTIYDLPQLTAYESKLIRNYLQTPPGVEKAFRIGYPELDSVSQTLAKEGIAYRSIVDTFNHRAGSGEIFLDFCHVNHEGNRLIAQRIFNDYFLR